MTNAYAMIMAGGKGERFWPLSTSQHPKQTLSLFGGRPLLEQAIDRLDGIVPPERILIITSQSLVEPIQASVPRIPAGNIIGEPMGRDTAAACALGTAIVQKRCPNGLVGVMTADHIIRDIPIFQDTLRAGYRMAQQTPSIVTIGIAPTSPSTGFGYIECGETMDDASSVSFRRAKRFVEKPDKATAEAYLAEGTYLWNSGMFIWSVETFMQALHTHRPSLQEMCDQLYDAIDGDAFPMALAEAYDGLEKISVDFAIMEHAANIVVARGEFPWFDVGSWAALETHFDSDDSGNVVVGGGECMDAENNIVVSQDHVTALIGVRDLVVVHAEGATLVCHRDRVQDVKMMVKHLSATGSHDAIL